MKKTVIPILTAALLASCSSNEFEQDSLAGERFIDKVVITSEPFTFEDGTRTALTNTGSAIEFNWKNGEAIGIFPIAPTTNNQAKQVINASGDASMATFDGAGWALLKGNTYAAYSPFMVMSNEVPSTAVPIDMTGQTQNGNASLSHIGDKYDYMYTSDSIPTKGNVSFDFKHVGSIVMLNIKAPASATWSKFTLTNKAGNKVFTTNATMNVSNGEITSVTKSDAISLDLTNVSTTLGEAMSLYMSVLPATTGELTASLTDNEGKKYVTTLESKTLVAGKAYRYGNPTFNMNQRQESSTVPPVYYGTIVASNKYFLAEEESSINDKSTVDTLAKLLNNMFTALTSTKGFNFTFNYYGDEFDTNVKAYFTTVEHTAITAATYRWTDVALPRELDGWGSTFSVVLIPESSPKQLSYITIYEAAWSSVKADGDVNITNVTYFNGDSVGNGGLDSRVTIDGEVYRLYIRENFAPCANDNDVIIRLY